MRKRATEKASAFRNFVRKCACPIAASRRTEGISGQQLRRAIAARRATLVVEACPERGLVRSRLRAGQRALPDNNCGAKPLAARSLFQRLHGNVLVGAHAKFCALTSSLRAECAEAEFAPTWARRSEFGHCRVRVEASSALAWARRSEFGHCRGRTAL